MGFHYQAIDASGQTVEDTIDADSHMEAAELLRERGLFVTSLDGLNSGDSSAGSSSGGTKNKSGKLRDVVLFAQQMSMLLRAGSQVVQALEVVEDQASRLAWRNVVTSIRADVQEGKPLSAALSRYPDVFPGVWMSMVTAGEASGELGVAFDRLALLARQQQEVRNRVIGAVSYPIVLTVLCSVVMTILFTFILPRFAEMFEALDADLPASTAILIASSNWVWAHWPYLVVGLATVVVSLTVFLRSTTGHRYISMSVVRAPIFGLLVRKIILARICRVWGQLLESKVGLLDTIELIERTTKNHEFKDLMGRIAEAVNNGNPVGSELRASWLIPKTFSGAVATGEESGRLADSLMFVATSLEDENVQNLSSLSHVIEPIILAVMGIVVGTMAFSLFLPMFDMATKTGG